MSGDAGDEKQDEAAVAAAAAAAESSLYSSWLSTDFGNASLSTLDLQGSDSWGGGGTPSPAGSSVWASHGTLGAGAFFPDSSTSSLVPGPRGGGALTGQPGDVGPAGHRRTRSGDARGDPNGLLLGSASRPGSVGPAGRAVSLGLPPGRAPSLHGADPAAAPDPHAVTSDIHDAARITNWDRVHRLSLTQPQSARYTGPDRWTALHHACSRRCPHASVVEALLRAYPGALLDLDEKAWTPLHHAARFKAPRDVVRLLLGAYPDMGRTAAARRCSRGRTPLYYAIRYDAPDGVVEMLLEADPTAVLEPDRDGVTPLGLVWDKYATSFEGKRAVQPYLSMLQASVEGGEGERKREGMGASSSSTSTSSAAASSAGERLVALKGGGTALLTNKKLRSKWEKADTLLRAAFRFPLSDEGDDRGGGGGGRDGDDGKIVEGIDEDGEMDSPAPSPRKQSPQQEAGSEDVSVAAAAPKRRRKWRILHAASAVKCHFSLFSLACVLYPEQAHEIDENDLYGDDADVESPVGESSRGSNDPSSNAAVAAAAAQQQQQQQQQQQPEAKSSHRTALHFAASSPSHGKDGRTVLTCLLALNPGAASVPDGVDGSLPLHLAAENERKAHWTHDGLAVLHAANVDAVRATDGWGRTPLHRACAVLAHRGGGVPSSATVAPPAPAPAPAAAAGGAPTDGTAEATSTSGTDAAPAQAPAAPTAASIGSVIQNLVALHPGAARAADSTGRFPLHLVAEHGEAWNADAEAVLDANPAAARARAGPAPPCLGRLPIHMAAASPDAGATLIGRLVSVHPRGASMPDASGKLPLHLACESGKRWADGVATILDAHPPAVTLREDNSRRWTALHMASACPHAGPDLIGHLLEARPDAASEADGRGRYPLHLACASGKPWESGLKLIFDAYPDAAIRGDSNGWLPFHCAAMSYSVVPPAGAGAASSPSATGRGSVPRTGSLSSSDDSVVTTSTGEGEREHDAASAAMSPLGGEGGDGAEDSIDELAKINILYNLIKEAPHVV